VLVAALGAIAAVLPVTSGARGSAPQRSLAAAISVTQTCSVRVQPHSRIDVQATLKNPGDQQLRVTAVDGDAGTPDNPADDFVLTLTGGDTNGNGLLDPGEQWTYVGHYTAGIEDMTNIVGADALSVPGGVAVSDLAPCTTDVIQNPIPGVIVRVDVVSGVVLVRKPGSNKFTALPPQTEIPIGSVVDATNGTLRLTSALGGGKTNSANFYAGAFTILQNRGANAITNLRLYGGNFGICRGKGRSSAQSLDGIAKSKKPVRRVWGNGKGRFSTQGRYSSATVRGTHWLTQDQCNGTLTKVLRGIVAVHVFRSRKNVSVPAGHSYLAPAP
jgi:hypothetical protein